MTLPALTYTGQVAIEPAAYPVQLINLDVEAAVLGALMADNRLSFDLVDIIEPDDFAEPLHGRIYQQIMVIIDRGATASPVTMSHLFHDDQAMREIGGPGYLAQLTSQSILVGVREHAAEIADLAQRRRLWDGARHLVAMASDPSLTKMEIVEGADMTLMAALAGKSNVSSQSVGQAWDAAMADIEAEAAGRKAPGIKFNELPDLNDIGLKFRPGQFVILAGRPGMGKTALAVKAGIGAAQNGHGTLYITLEVPGDEIATRIIADRVYSRGQSATFKDLTHDRLTALDRNRLAEQRQYAREWPLQIFDPPTMRLSRIAMTIRRYQRRMAAKGHRLELVIIDHIGLIRGDGRKSKYEETTEVSNAMKALAKDLGVCIVALCQLSRDVEKRDDKRPVLSDLRDSGSLEQDADAVVFVYREQYYLEQAEPPASSSDPAICKKRAAWEEAMDQARDKMDVYAAKNRQGGRGRRQCWFFMEHQAVRGRDFFQGDYR